MAILHIRNIPKDLHAAIRREAKKNLRTMSAEVLLVLKHHFPTTKELRKRRELFKKLQKIHARKVVGNAPSTEEMLREDRER
jgi:plasmid stability protein